MEVNILLRGQDRVITIKDSMANEFIDKFKEKVKYIVLNNHPTEQMVVLKDDIQAVQISRTEGVEQDDLGA